MTGDFAEEVIQTFRRAYKLGTKVRVEATDGRTVTAAIERIEVDDVLTDETGEEPRCGHFRACFWPEHMSGISDWQCDGSVSIVESHDGGWRPPVVGWTTATDAHGNRVDQYWAEVQSVEVVNDE
jgi:hypothetical protein